MKSATFARRMRDEFTLDPACDALVEAIKQSMERAESTAGTRDARAEGRLQNELIRTLLGEIAKGDREQGAEVYSLSEERSVKARKAALVRWHGKNGEA